MNQMRPGAHQGNGLLVRPVTKRDNLYTLSLFALKLWLFRLKYILKLRKHTFKNVDKFFGVVHVVGKCPAPGTR